MPKTFIFEELDDRTREYLTAVRENEGVGSPGVFVHTTDALPGCGCIAGPIIIITTLLLTLTTWLGIIYNDPIGVAFLQTAGLLVGSWLLFAKFRGRGAKNAGTWVYVDPLFMYEAYREQVTVTRVDDVVDANYTHNYDSNGNYQNSVVNVMLGGRRSASVTLKHEGRAEHMVTFLNYLAWARSPEGGARGEIEPADLGGLARYVAKNGDEPKDAEGNVNLRLIELDITEVPDEPAREGHSLPALLPYVFIFLGSVMCFVVMAFVINPVVRDDALYDLVTKETSPPSLEPRFLRAYLVDSRNTLHRKQVLEKLARFYDPAITHVQKNAADRRLGQGMADVLKGLSTADQPVVSLRVTETRSPAGKAGSKGTRENALRTQFADGVNTTFAAQSWGQPIQLPAGFVATETLPPIGHQLIAFVEPPDDAKAVHFDIAYAVEDVANGQFQVVVNVTLRANIEDPAEVSGQFKISGAFNEAELDGTGIIRIKDELIRNLIGTPGFVGVPGGGLVVPQPVLP
ncbi:hypothetical protein VT84_20625 [Gemmata sp. SH-PL17]|uniref:hypothetical protein n=1 Tax=Gemmata sp. SH-PL17 TaxID=1630693 RepID=UPI0004B006D1|nr:hypothetical protein [Gemmata sp. SH-PL17]AMV26817.1 hypothetical protein VT84_20625 [Gemmata sp. SH-PL17]